MNTIWANRLISKIKTGSGKEWADVPAYRQDGVKTELKSRVASSEITPDQYETITGEAYSA